MGLVQILAKKYAESGFPLPCTTVLTRICAAVDGGRAVQDKSHLIAVDVAVSGAPNVPHNLRPLRLVPRASVRLMFTASHSGLGVSTAVGVAAVTGASPAMGVSPFKRAMMRSFRFIHRSLEG